MGQKAERHTLAFIRLRANDCFFCFPESEGLCTLDLILGWSLLRIEDRGLRIGDNQKSQFRTRNLLDFPGCASLNTHFE
jgi:hypothetical protein